MFWRQLIHVPKNRLHFAISRSSFQPVAKRNRFYLDWQFRRRMEMRKLVVWNLMTLDGYFEGTKPWDIDFHNLAWGPELQRYAEQFGREGVLLVFGRKTYEGMAAYWPTAEGEGEIKAYMNGIAKIAV
jgi:hypothetical protein